MTSADGKELASASEEVKIGHMPGTIVHEMTNETVNKKGGYDLVFAWAADTNMKMLNDLLPGMFGPYYQMSTMQLSVSCETAEYLSGKIALLLYGNTAKSTSYCLEVAKYLQLQHTVENPDIASYYAFDLGEPQFQGKQAQIVALSDGESVRICRIDKLGDELDPALYEFYNVFPAGTLRAGGTYFVSVQGRDRNGADIEGMTLDFTLRS